MVGKIESAFSSLIVVLTSLRLVLLQRDAGAGCGDAGLTETKQHNSRPLQLSSLSRADAATTPAQLTGAIIDVGGRYATTYVSFTRQARQYTALRNHICYYAPVQSEYYTCHHWL